MRLSFSKYVKNYIYTFIYLLFVQQRVDFHSNRVLDLYTCRLNFGQTSSSLFDQSFHWYKDAIIIGLELFLDLYTSRLNFGQTSSSLFDQSFHWFKDAILFLLIG